MGASRSSCEEDKAVPPRKFGVILPLSESMEWEMMLGAVGNKLHHGQFITGSIKFEGSVARSWFCGDASHATDNSDASSAFHLPFRIAWLVGSYS